MKYLKGFNENRREDNQSLYEDLRDIVQELQDDFDFKTYITPYETALLQLEPAGVNSIEELLKVIPSEPKKISRALKAHGRIHVYFDLDSNGISRKFEDEKRIEIINQIKNTIESCQSFLNTNGYRFTLQGIGYEDVKPGGKTHDKN